jgi:DNA repair protein RadC
VTEAPCVVLPELDDLELVFGDAHCARHLAEAPGGWRDLSEHELGALGLRDGRRRAVLALQRLVRHGYPELPKHQLSQPEDVGRVYGERLGSLTHEVMLAVALDGQCHPLGEIQLATGGRHGMAITAVDILRPLIRAGATSFILIHNHPSSSPEPSPDDITMTHALSAVADIAGVPLVDHVIVAARGGGFTSMLELGIIDPPKESSHEQAVADPAL